MLCVHCLHCGRACVSGQVWWVRRSNGRSHAAQVQRESKRVAKQNSPRRYGHEPPQGEGRIARAGIVMAYSPGANCVTGEREQPERRAVREERRGEVDGKRMGGKAAWTGEAEGS